MTKSSSRTSNGKGLAPTAVALVGVLVSGLVGCAGGHTASEAWSRLARPRVRKRQRLCGRRGFEEAQVTSPEITHGIGTYLYAAQSKPGFSRRYLVECLPCRPVERNEVC